MVVYTDYTEQKSLQLNVDIIYICARRAYSKAHSTAYPACIIFHPKERNTKQNYTSLYYIYQFHSNVWAVCALLPKSWTEKSEIMGNSCIWRCYLVEIIRRRIDFSSQCDTFNLFRRQSRNPPANCYESYLFSLWKISLKSMFRKCENSFWSF